jgi:phosphatidate cytidylyltransferase
MTAVVLAVGLLLALFILPAEISSLLFGLLLLIGAWEWARLATLKTNVSRGSFAILVLIVALALKSFVVQRIGLLSLAWIDVSILLLGLLWMLRFPVPIPKAYTLLTGLLVLPIGWLLISQLLSEWGPRWALLLFGLVAAADIGAFFAGRSLGRVKLARSVSPGKTWEGVAGGAIASALVATIAALWGGMNVPSMAGLGLLIAAVSVLGDLTISMFKRNEGIKDTGTIFPGHGGVLDRIDSLLAALPVFFIGVGVILSA